MRVSFVRVRINTRITLFANPLAETIQRVFTDFLEHVLNLQVAEVGLQEQYLIDCKNIIQINVSG